MLIKLCSPSSSTCSLWCRDFFSQMIDNYFLFWLLANSMSTSDNADKVLYCVTRTAVMLYRVLCIFRSNIRTLVTLLGILSCLGFKPLPVLGLEVIMDAVVNLCRDVIAESAAQGGELRTQLC